jgi:hypothetical protein
MEVRFTAAGFSQPDTQKSQAMLPMREEEVSTLAQDTWISLCATSPAMGRRIMSMDQQCIFALLGISCQKSNALSV